MGAYFLAFFRLFYPALCSGCGKDLAVGERFICLHCRQALIPVSASGADLQPMERILPPGAAIERAEALYFYGKGQIAQHLLYAVKYRRQRRLAVHLGEELGRHLKQQWTGSDVALLMPVPLHPSRQRLRGFNQSAAICEGMRAAMHLPVVADQLRRIRSTPTQTHKSRTERWSNVCDAFELRNAGELEGRHILLVDDVVTTGSTLLACAAVLQRVRGVRVSLAAVAIAAEL